jgi:ATP-dependent protease ClpP protease subunit
MTKKPNPKPWVINQTASNAAEVLIYEDIGMFGVDAKSFTEELGNLAQESSIDVRISSGGGDVFQGLAIYQALSRFTGQVNVFIDGLAASMASAIAMAGDTITMAGESLMMIHDPVSFAGGNADDLSKTIEMLDRAKASLVSIYAKRTGMASAAISALMQNETWMTADEAVEMGFADAVDASIAIAATTAHIPDKIPDRFKGQIAAIHGAGVPRPQTVTAAAVEAVQPPPPATGVTDMANETTPTAQPATIDELQALPGANDAFVLSQLKEKRTLPESVTALLAVVSARNTELAAANEALETQANATQPAAVTPGPQAQAPGPVVVATNAGAQPAAPLQQLAPQPMPGVQPIPTNATVQEPQAFQGDPVAIVRQKTEALMASGMSPWAAVQKVYREQPELYAAMGGDQGRVWHTSR